MSGQLPPGFEALEPFVARWAVEGTANRAALRDTSSETERAAFYAAATPLLGPALDHLNCKSLDQFDERETRLMNLMLSLTHVSLAIEVQGEYEAAHVHSRPFLRITRSSADYANT